MPAVVKGNILCYKGSSYFRQRLVLSVLSNKPVRITEIRSLQDEPGLLECEVNFIRLLDKITNGTIIELNETGTSLYFQPGLLYGGTVEHDCSLQRSVGEYPVGNTLSLDNVIFHFTKTGYYLEALVMLGLFCKSPLNVTLKGVTSNNLDPSVDHIKVSMMSVLKKFILDDEGLELSITKRGN